MKKTEIAPRVFEIMDRIPVAPVAGGPVGVPPTAIAGLALVPWFCDLSIQWALRLTIPGEVLARKDLPKVPGTLIAAAGSGSLLVGVPGDGIAPSTHALVPLAGAVAAMARSGLQIELATANLGTVKRDYDATADTSTDFGNQLYRGTVDQAGMWQIMESAPALNGEILRLAIACGRLVPDNGPWVVRDRDEAYQILMQWLLSREANINPAAVKRFVRLQDSQFHTDDADMVRRLHGLALGFFRHRIPGGPFRWPEPKPYFNPLSDLEDAARTVTG